jgi:hypothetical protein
MEDKPTPIKPEESRPSTTTEESVHNDPKPVQETHLSTNERNAASEDVRHLNAEQDEEQLRKDEEARRNHKSK